MVEGCSRTTDEPSGGAAYIHKAEHLDERRLMIQWWADYLDVNRDRVISPFDYTEINNPMG
ncbi:hypothetical protein KD4_30460 [Yersinia pseudotuberculosis]